ncbi:hypothetical protein LCGC14_0554930 [marine sediment metagenome]|uniref:Uncharacterized protein n=1 Tax=marine sediment metagenome TaxID=412755 RepID=A0A0F9UWZ3_9ZZZZ
MKGIRKVVTSPVFLIMVAIALAVGSFFAVTSAGAPPDMAESPTAMLLLGGEIEMSPTGMLAFDASVPAYMAEDPAPAASNSVAVIAVYVVGGLLIVSVVVLLIVSHRALTGLDTPTDSDSSRKARSRYPRDGIRPAPLGA